MRKYTLASSSAKSTVDLTDYTEVITAAVHEVMPKANVIVEKDCYYVDPAPSKGDAIRIGIPMKEAKHEERKQQLSGGHH